MEDGKQKLLKSTTLLSLSTLFSRLLGFFRESFMAFVLGGDAVMSAWVLATTLPNLFRRILGEGALGTALIPMIVHTMEQSGAETARRKFSTIFIWLTLLLTILTLVIAVPSAFLADFFLERRWKLAAFLIPFVMPYSIFICSVGIITSYANSLREYFLPSLCAILQNTVMIAGLFLLMKGIHPGFTDNIVTLAFALITAGILELLLMLWIIRWKKMTLIFDKSVFRDWDAIKSILKLAFPGLIGASALQLSLVIDRLIAGWIGDYAPSSLYFSERLVYLPIGVFAFAFGTVSLSEMSRIAVKKEYASMISMMMFSLRNLLFITIPIAVFMFLFSPELIRVFFMRGKFSEIALSETAYAMQFYSLGIPLFAAYKISVTGFTARKDMMTPLKASLIAVVANILLNLALMIPLKQGGIALATVCSSLINNFLLFYLLSKEFGRKFFDFPRFLRYLLKLTGISILSGAAAFAAGKYWFYLVDLRVQGLDNPACSGRRILEVVDFSTAMTSLILGAAAFGIVFPVLSLIFRMEEAKTLLIRFVPKKLQKFGGLS